MSELLIIIYLSFLERRGAIVVRVIRLSIVGGARSRSTSSEVGHATAHTTHAAHATHLSHHLRVKYQKRHPG